jgi:hypothetical protein
MTQTQITWDNKRATRKNRYTATCQHPANHFRYSSDGSDTKRRPGETRFGVYTVIQLNVWQEGCQYYYIPVVQKYVGLMYRKWKYTSCVQFFSENVPFMR